jgi:galactokinase
MVHARATLAAQQLFKRAFGYQAAFTSLVPGRVELLGSYAEIHEGLSLLLTVNRHWQAVASPRPDGRIVLVTNTQPAPEKFWLSDLAPNPKAAWAEPIKTVLRELRRRGVGFTGFNAAFHSEFVGLPDLGETAALRAAIAMIVRALCPYKLTETGCMNRPPTRNKRGQLPPLSKLERLAMAKLCRQAEARESGGPGSLQDHLAPFCGRNFHALCADGRFQTVECLPMVGELVVVLCPSGVEPQNLAAETEKRRRLAETAAKTLHARNLRSVDPAYLSAHRMKLTEQEYACAYHLVGETQRVVFAERALNEGDFAQLGQYLLESHESARDFFQVSCPELDLLVDLARHHPGCFGARQSGPGFGGATVNLLTWNHYEDFIRNIAAQYEHHTSRRIKPFVCQLVDGAE